MKNFLKEYSGNIVSYVFTLLIVLTGIVYSSIVFYCIAIVATGLSCWISYLQGYTDAIKRENAIKVVHTIKETTDKVVIKEYAGEHDDLSAESTYEYNKQWADKFQHIVAHKRN